MEANAQLITLCGCRGFRLVPFPYTRELKVPYHPRPWYIDDIQCRTFVLEKLENDIAVYRERYEPSSKTIA